MNTAVMTPVNTMPAQVVPTSVGGRLLAMPAKQKWMLGLGLAGLAAVIAALAFWSSTGNYKVLFANLSDKDGGAIVAQLSQMNVPYRYTEGGGAILVPADRVHDVRLKLASAGLPKGSVVGYELMENQRFGATQFQERLNFQRGLEGELVRSIQEIDAVENARVHLALPNQNGFYREQQKPSASVVLNLRAGRTLDRQQIAGIVHLVASSVPELTPKAVSILDQSGALISNPDETNTAGLDATQLQYVHQLESNYTKRVMDILEPVVGRDNLRAQVTADVDFSQIESTSEEFKPNQGQEPATVRSQQVSEAGGTSPGTPSGIPGAASNQPPTPATAPINGQAQTMQAAAQQGGSGGSNSRRDSTVNYEVDRTVKVTKAATGNIKRINAAVVVNHITKTDKKGKTSTAALTDEEIDKLTSIVKETIGFNAERGDSVKVVSAPFKVDQVEPDNLPLWKQPEIKDLLQTSIVPATLALVTLLIVFGVIRPALKAMNVPKATAVVDAVIDDPQMLPGGTMELSHSPALAAGARELPALEAPQSDVRLETARELAKSNPAVMANIVKSWINKDA